MGVGFEHVLDLYMLFLWTPCCLFDSVFVER